MRFLSKIRKMKGLTQLELSVISGIGSNSIARYERGEIVSSIETAEILAKALNVTVDDLLNGLKTDRKITLSYDWEEYEKGEVNMNGEGYELFLGTNGAIGLKGSKFLTSMEAIDKVLEEIKIDLIAGFNAQKARGLIKE